MKNLCLKLAKWIVPKDQVVIPRSLLRTLSGRDEPILQDQFESDVIDGGEPGPVKVLQSTELWRETRKQLVEEKQDGQS